ncbi:MAG: hypothetical protein WAK10_07360, partial [Methanoregula sp.]
MNLHHVLSKRDIIWDTLIVVSSSAAVLANLIGLLSGLSIVLPHLLYIPVVIAAYRYPKWGLFIAVCIGGMYFLMVFLISGSSFT